MGYSSKGTREKPTAHPASFSAMTNIRAAETFHNGGSSYTSKNLILSPYINIYGLCLEGEASYEHSSNSREKGKFRRAYTTLVYDWASEDIMFKYGDVFSHSLSYQSAPRVWGFNIHKDVEREKSEGVNSPIQITLLRTSTIEVYSKGNLIRTRTQVAPGTYIFDDLSYHSGENDIKIKIIDDTGREQILDESCFFESSLVTKGKFTFNGTYGYTEVNKYLSRRYDKKNHVL